MGDDGPLRKEDGSDGRKNGSAVVARDGGLGAKGSSCVDGGLGSRGQAELDGSELGVDGDVTGQVRQGTGSGSNRARWSQVRRLVQSRSNSRAGR